MIQAMMLIFIAVLVILDRRRSNRNESEFQKQVLKDLEVLGQNQQTLYEAILKLEEATKPVLASRLVMFQANDDGTFERVTAMSFQKVTKKKKYSVVALDAKGNVAKIDGAPKWAVTDESLATIVVAEDGMSAEVTPVGPLGSYKVQAKADADLMPDVEKDILAEADVELVAGDATELRLVEGEESDI